MTVGRLTELVAQIGIAHETLGTMIVIGTIIKIEIERRRQSQGMSGSVIVTGVAEIDLSALGHHLSRTVLALKGTHDDGDDVRSRPHERNMIQAALRELVIDAASKILTSYFLYERTTAVDDLWMVKVLSVLESQ
jgi:hypothetical protein